MLVSALTLKPIGVTMGDGQEATAIHTFLQPSHCHMHGFNETKIFTLRVFFVQQTLEKNFFNLSKCKKSPSTFIKTQIEYENLK